MAARIFALYLTISYSAFAEPLADNAFPVIARLRSGDVVFMQYEEAVREGRRVFTSAGKSRISPEEWAQKLQIFAYAPRSDDAIDDTALSLAARCGVTQASIATLNRVSHADMRGLSTILLPTVSGIFVREKPVDDMERLIAAARKTDGAPLIMAGGESFYFFPGDDFSPTERAFFLSAGNFRFPLDSWTVTSRFGSRLSPITGNASFHGGLDLAADMGSSVYASAGGVVEEAGESPVYGIFVVVRHSNGWTSLYGHLSRALVKVGARVTGGEKIGEVGSTGLSTGPHLHFELRQNGKAEDPQKLLK